ncbi:unnamed protein product [Schistosoma turkestanicum]|nr:unnamed protein product [Schistosoma turkestanicum]
MRQSVDNTSTQTDPMIQTVSIPAVIPNKTIDVQTQSGFVKCDSETQTLHEPHAVPVIKDVSVRHESHHVQTVNKKLQAMVSLPSDDVCLQTDELTVHTVKPITQAVYRAPEVEHKQTQAEFMKTAVKTYDIQTQSGTVVSTQSTQTILEERPLVHTADVGVIHSEKSPSLVNKKLQVTMRQSVDNTSTQTDPMVQIPVVVPKTTFDVVTQSGTIFCAQAVQTVPEERPILHTADVSVIHSEKSPSVLHRNVQATVRQSLENSSTQTDPMVQIPVVVPKTTFDVVTQSGTIFCAQAVQTVPEERPILHTADVSVIHSEKSPSVLHRNVQATVRQSLENSSTQTDPMVQIPAVVPKTTFDVVTQSGTIFCAQAVQTVPEERPILRTADVNVIHGEMSPSLVSKKLQATMRQSLENSSTQTDPMVQIPVVVPKTTFDVVTQSGTIFCAQAVQTVPEERPILKTADVSVIHSEKSPSLVNKKLQVTMRQSVDNTSTQTDPMIQTVSIPAVIPNKTIDVQTQSGFVKCDSETQTLHEPHAVPVIKDVSVRHESHHVQTVNKKLQAMVSLPSDDVCLQTDELTVHTVKPITQAVYRAPEVEHKQTQAEFMKTAVKTYDIQTQSGTVVSTQSTQTILEERPLVHTADVGVIHSEKSPSLVNKKLQVTMRQSVDNTSTQTDLMIQTVSIPAVIPNKTIDVQTQSGFVKCDSETQTLHEPHAVPVIKDVSVRHESHHVQTVNKKLQAMVSLPSDDVCLQTDELTVHTVKPITQAVYRAPEVEHKQTQAEFMKTAVKTYDIQTQSGTVVSTQSTQTILEERPLVHTADVGVIHSEKSPSLVNKKLQVTMRQSVDNTSMQTDPMVQIPVVVPKTTFDVVTQSGTIFCAQAVQTVPEERPILHTADVSVIHSEKSPSVLHRNVQATVRQSLENSSTQTDPMVQIPVVVPKTTFDVVTQSGTIFCAQAVQTVPEERPILHTADVSVIHSEKSPSVLHRNVQATVRQSLENSSTQTDPMVQIPVVVPKTTFDVVTQSGTIFCAQAVQTVPEERPILHTADVSVIHSEKSPSVLHRNVQATVRQSLENSSTQTDPMVQIPAVVPKTTFDVVTQSGTIFCAQAVQTVPEERPILRTADVNVIHGEMSPSLVSKKLQATMRQSLENSSTQTDPMVQIPVVVPKTTFDVVTQSGTIFCAQAVQTVPEERPILHTADVSVIHSEKSPSVLHRNVQATVRQSLENSSTQTDPMVQIPVVVPKTTFDVVTQSGTIFCAQAVQTVPEERPILRTADVNVIHGEMSPSLVSKKLQATMRQSLENSSTQTDPMVQIPVVVPKTTFDVVTQSGTIFCAQAVQTVPEEPRVSHSINRKVQCSPNSKDSSVQVEAFDDKVVSSSTSIAHSIQVIPQLTQTTPSTTFDVQIQSGVIFSSDATQTIDFSPATEMKETSVTHEKEPAVLKGKKLQVRCDLADLAVQTDQIMPAVQPTISSTMHTVPSTSQSIQTIPCTTYDVQIQSGVIFSSDATQTIDFSPATEMKETSVTHEKEPAVLKGKKLQVRCDLADLAVQTDQIMPAVQPTISSTMHTVPSTSQSTQTSTTTLADAFCQAKLPSTTYDVQIQSGVVYSSDGTQTIDFSPATEMKETSVTHEKEPAVLKGKKLQVRCDLADLAVQTDQIMPAVQPTISSTMHTVPSTSQSIQTIPCTTYDVQIQSGVIFSSDATQTIDFSPATEMKETSVTHEKEPAVLKGKKLQVRCDLADLAVQTDQIMPAVQPTISSTMHTVPSTSQSIQTIPCTTYDVQIQSGVIFSSDATQTIDFSPATEMKETSVTHEKEPAVLKGKKLQVRCDLADLAVQTDQIKPTVNLNSKFIQTTFIPHTDVSCQYSELVKPSSVSHATTSTAVSVQTDMPYSAHLRVDQRNKKFQVNLISPSSPKTPPNVTSSGTQTSDYGYQNVSIKQVDKTTVSSVDAYMIHDSVSNVESSSQEIPKVKIDQECQVKITPQQSQKKLQFGSSFSMLKNISSQTVQDGSLHDYHRDSMPLSIGVQVSNVRQVVTVDTGTQETRSDETSLLPSQVKNKKLQVYPSKLGEQVEEEFIHSQGISTSLTELTQTDESLLKNIKCFKCMSRGNDKKIQSEYTTVDKDVQSQETSVKTKQTASATVKSNYFTRILQMETIPVKLKAEDELDMSKQYIEFSHRARNESRSVQTDTFLLNTIQLPEGRMEVDSVGKISKKTTIVQLEKLTTDKCVDTIPFKKELVESQTSYYDILRFDRRNVKLQKGKPWSEAQMPDIQFETKHSLIIDSSGSYSPQQNSVAVSARPTTTSILPHVASTSRNGNGKSRTLYQHSKPDVISWGVQFAPVTLTGVTQTTESLKHKLTIDSSVNVGVQTDDIEDDYYIKRVVTTIARKGLSSYCRRGPVARKIVEHTDLLTSSLPSNLDEEFDEEITVGPKTTKVTTMQKRGDRRVVHEELLTEDYRERGSSLDSHVAHIRSPRETHLRDIDLHEMHEHETDIYSDAEICLQNLLRVWGEQYLLSRLRTISRSSELSVSLGQSIQTAGKSRLVEAKTQFTSTGNLVSHIRNLENIGTQTSDILLTTRPSHKNKRIQRGHSFISGGANQPPQTRSASALSPMSPTTEELTSHHRQHGITSMQTHTSHPLNLATTTFTETTQEQSTFSIEHTVQTYVCPTCGSQANIPVTVHSQIQPQALPITQLKDAQSQTRFIGQTTTDNNYTYLPTYLSDDEVIRINQSQRIEDKEFSMVTWHPAETRDTERRRDSDRSKQIRDEVWVDSPGKLLELKITGVVVPGTNKIVSASEAFYRGLLRVVYWDYEKLGPRQSSIDYSTVSIPLTDAVISKSVRLANDRTSTETQPSLDAKIVWRTPEIQRSRYLVHSIRPDAGQNKHDPINLDIASAIRAGLIDKETGRMLFTHSICESSLSTDSPISKKGDSSSDQTEQLLSIREAIVRGFLVAELIEPESSSSYITKQSIPPFIVPSTSYSHSPTDVDI